MIVQIAIAVCILVWFVLLRPRQGSKDAPPTVTFSTVAPVPIFGVLIEFFKSPNNMIKRCLTDYGGVFTIPVCVLSNFGEISQGSGMGHILFSPL